MCARSVASVTRVLRAALQADEIVELCDNAERLFKQEKSVLELRVSGTCHASSPG